MDTPAEVPDDAPILKVAKQVLAPLRRYFDVSLEGTERVPEGPVFLVGNHALLGIDSVVLFPELYRQFGRVPRGLALRSLFTIPGVRDLLRGIGVVEGCRETAIELLEAGQMVVTYPGGARDSVKSKHQAYELQWEGRTGFADVAIRAQAPVVPVAGIGPDDVFPFLSDDGVIPAPFLGNASYRFPLFLPIARPVPCTFRFGEPIAPPEFEVAAGEEGTVPQARVEAFAGEVQGALRGLIDEGLRERGEAEGWMDRIVGKLLG